MTARRAAYDALTAITRDGAYVSLALKQHIPASLSVEDKRFVTRLVRTTLENLLRIDYALTAFMRSGRVHGSVRNILRIGACQLMFMNTAEYAAVGESVALAKRIKPQTAGFVNAVLRALAAGKDAIRYPQGENAQALSIETSYPEWICEKYIRDFGYEFAQALLSYRDTGGTTVRLNTLKANEDGLKNVMDKLGFVYENGSVPGAYMVQGLTDIENLDIFRDGWIAVQSQSAMRAVLEAAPQPGEKLLDACAAPGGKSAYAAALTDNQLQITAWDVHPHRVEMTNKNYLRLGVVGAEATLRDASVYGSEFDRIFDCVIVDAPCSAMGLMASSADIRYNRKPGDIIALAEKQYGILSTCAGYVKPGGRLAYFTCSFNREENEAVTERFLKENSAYAYEKEPETIYPHKKRLRRFLYRHNEKERMNELLSLDLEQLKNIIAELGGKPFMAGQLQQWLTKGVSFEDMTNLPKALRGVLRNDYTEGYAGIVEKHESADGTVKLLLSLAGGGMVECVVMRYKYGNTLCVSTQVGCRMGCAFCASGVEGLVRNLTMGEMRSEFIAAQQMGESRQRRADGLGENHWTTTTT